MHDLDSIKVKIFTGHKQEVNFCCLSKDYHFLVTASDDSKLLLWDVSKESVICELIGHTGPVNCCTFSPDDKAVASASYDSSVRLWDTTTSDVTSILTGHTKSVEHVNFSKDGNMLCSSSWDRLIIVWDTKSGSLLHTLPGHGDCVKTCTFSHDPSMIGSGSWDGEVRVWRLDQASNSSEDEIAKWNLRRFEKINSCSFGVSVLKAHKGNVQAVAFSTKGLMVSGSWDRLVCLWDPYRAELLKKFVGHTGWVKAVNFSLNSIEIVSCADDDTVRVWNILSGKCSKIYPAQTDIAQVCFFSKSGNLLTSGTALMT